MNLKNTLLTFTLSFCVAFSFGQSEWSNWYFNGNNMLAFPNNTVQYKNNFISPAPSYWWNYVYSSYIGTSYSDKATGQMKFLLSARTAYDKNYDMINKTEFLRMCPNDRYSYHILPFNTDPNKFYIIQFQSLSHDLAAQETGLQVRCPNAIGLGYSILDLSLNNGLGDFTTINKVVETGIPERISVIRHANGKDAWVVVHGWGNNQFRAYLFTDAGVSAPVTSTIGPVISGGSLKALGNMVASHNGKTIAAQQYGSNSVEFYDFNNNTGTLSNYRTLQVPSSANAFVFSPDDTKFYYLSNYLASGLYQYNLKAANIQSSIYKVVDDPSTSYYDMQCGPDGKIYLSRYYYYDDNSSYLEYLSIVNCPNLAEAACNFKQKGVKGYFGNFPVFVNDYIKQPEGLPATKFSLGNDTAICFGQHTLTAPLGWESYQWNTGETTRQITVTKPGTYYVLAGSSGFSCPEAYGMIKISRIGSPLNLGKDTVVCPKTPYTIHVPDNYNNITWNDGAPDRDKVVTTPGKYSVKAYDQNGCANWDTISVGIWSDPRANFGNDTILCNNQSLVLRLQPQYNAYVTSTTYLWQDGSKRDTLTVTKPGTYWGKVSTSTCIVSDTIVVSYVNAENVYLGKDTTVCEGDSLLLQANVENASYLWNTGATSRSISVKNNGSYWVKVNNGSCTAADTINVSFQPKPSVFLGNDTTLCVNQKLTLRATYTGASYLWQDNSKNDLLTVTKPGIYWSQVTKNGCSVRDSISISYKPLPNINLGKDTGICINQTLLLNASDPFSSSYLWNDGSIQPTLTVKQAGTYFVKVSGGNGCSNADTITITTNPLPVFSLGADTSLCEQQLLTLQVDINNGSYKWSTGSQTNSINVNKSGIYWLDASINGCTKRDSISISYKPLPLVNIGSDTTLCEGATKILRAINTNATYKWNDLSNTPTYTVSKPGTYWVEVNLNDCISKDTIRISYNYKPKFTLGNDTLLCSGQQLVLNPRLTNVQYQWEDGSASSTRVITNAGVYKLTATNSCGSSSDEIRVDKSMCKLIMPTAFTPNNDGVNEVFKVKYPEFIKTFKMKVFGRWGEMIFYTEDPRQGWDGTFKKVPLESGNYIWQITLTDIEGNTDNAHGSVMLIR
jgi:gliding motility-associated-like protein